MKRWLDDKPLIAFFTLAFTISWLGILITFAATGARISATTPIVTGLVFVMMLLGPSVSGLALITAVDGKTGLLDLWGRLFLWKFHARWYLFALLTAPLCLLAILLLLGAFVSPAFAPHFQWTLLAVGLIAGSFEEIGWTGFATRNLLARHGVGTSGFALGMVWALWHALVVFLFSYAALGAGWIWSFAITYLATLIPYRILMTWVYANTKSLLLAVLMHASYSGWLLVLFPGTSPFQSLIWQSAFAASLWLAAALALRSSSRWAVTETFPARRVQGSRQREEP